MMRGAVLALVCGLAAPASAADIQSTFEGAWNQVSADPDCTKAEYPDFVLFTCDKELALWYFTKVGNAAHPGVVKRSVVAADDGSISVHESGRSFGSDEAQPAFKAWMDSIVALDARVRQEMKAKHDAQSPSKP